MIQTARFTARFILLTGGLLLIIGYNVNTRPLKTMEEVRYSQWLHELKASTEASEERPLAEVQLSLSIPDPAGEKERRVFSIAGKRSSNHTELLRLLDLAAEARLFRLSGPSGREALTFKVTDEDHSFSTAFTRTDIKSNVQAAIFLRLFKYFSGREKEQPAVEIITARH